MDKRTSEREVIAELRDGMTIGIGGWGSRRTPEAVFKSMIPQMPHMRYWSASLAV